MCPVGLERGVIRIAPYDPEWPRVYVAERERLAAARTGARLAMLWGASSVVRSLISAVGWGLVIAAVFAERNDKERG